MVTMAIVTFTNYKRGQTRGCMGAVMRYTMQKKKTTWEGQQLVTGIDCQPESVYADFMTSKQLYYKTDGVMFFHMVQSFPKNEEVDPVTAHAAALELARYYKGHEVLVCTHIDREHIHSHFIINSVNYDTGRKLHIAREDLQALRQLNDQVCRKFSLPVFQTQNPRRKAKSMSAAEYHIAARGHSKKAQLMYVIRDCMCHASNRDEFIALMESEGYQVRWEKNRGSITYTTPSGWKCRDQKLLEDRFLKENMEYEFAIRTALIHGRASGQEPSPAYEPSTPARRHTSDAADAADSDGSTAAQSHHREGVAGDDVSPADNGSRRTDTDRSVGTAAESAHHLRHGHAGGRTDPSGEGAAESGGTGWEKERETFFASRVQTAQTSPAPTGMAGGILSAVGGSGIGGALVHLGQMMEDDPDGTDDPEERRRRLEAQMEAKNLGAAVGLAVGVASVIAERLTDRPQASEGADKRPAAEKPEEQEPVEQVAPEKTDEPEGTEQQTPEQMEGLGNFQQEGNDECQTQDDTWQQAMLHLF